jgi:regulator of nonsense transcripts 2
LQSTTAVEIDNDEVEGDDEVEQEVVLIREPKHDEYDREAQSEFDREFAKMLADTTDVRRGERKAAPPIFDTAVPLIKRKPAEAGTGAWAGEAERMQFALLSKKGNKQQVRIYSTRNRLCC